MGKFLHLWLIKLWQCRPFPLCPFFILLIQEKFQLVEVRYQFIYCPNLSIHMSNCELPQKPLNLDEGKGKCHSTYYSVLIRDPLHELSISFIWPRGKWWVKCSNTCLRKYFLQVLHEWYSTSILNVGYLQSIVLRFGGLWINTSRVPILPLFYILLPSKVWAGHSRLMFLLQKLGGGGEIRKKNSFQDNRELRK